MTVGLARLIRAETRGLTDTEFERIWRAFDPAAQRVLTKLGHGRGITTSEARHLAAALRDQGIGRSGRGDHVSGDIAEETRRREAVESWQAAYRRIGRARDDLPAKDRGGNDCGDARNQQQGNGRLRGRHLESWKNAYRAIGRSKPEEDN